MAAVGSTIVRRLSPEQKTLYLTFDDGPDPRTTPAVLDVLTHHQARATFFTIAQSAGKQRHLIQQILKQNHTIGNHSLDHGYWPFFQSQARLKTWIQDSESLLRDITGRPTVGFRPPAGVVTPPLCRALFELRLPLILWSTRFYDAVLPWHKRRALNSLHYTRSGDILLLHDRQREALRSNFLNTLDCYLAQAKRQGYRLEALKDYGVASGAEPPELAPPAP